MNIRSKLIGGTTKLRQRQSSFLELTVVRPPFSKIPSPGGSADLSNPKHLSLHLFVRASCAGRTAAFNASSLYLVCSSNVITE
jgi:hypothetical protein